MEGFRMSYVAPKFEEKAFTCPYCGAYAQQNWMIYKLGIDSWNRTYVPIKYIKGEENGTLSADEMEKLTSLSISTCQ